MTRAIGDGEKGTAWAMRREKRAGECLRLRMELNLYVVRRERSGRADGLQRVRHEARLSSPVSTVRAEMAAVGARRPEWQDCGLSAAGAGPGGGVLAF